MPANFPGLKSYVDAALADVPGAERVRSRIDDGGLLSAVGDIVAQAYAAPEAHRQGMLAEAVKRYRALNATRDAALAVLQDAAADLNLTLTLP